MCHCHNAEICSHCCIYGLHIIAFQTLEISRKLAGFKSLTLFKIHLEQTAKEILVTLPFNTAEDLEKITN
jgi:hypothetical protein